MPSTKEFHDSVNKPHIAYRPDIDGLRALAVVSIILFHAFPKYITGGFIGVDIFFVISGYLISSIIFCEIDKGTFEIRNFYSRRVRRIFPALLLVLFSCWILGWLTLTADEYKQLGKQITTGALFVSNFSLWHEAGYFDVAAETKPLLHLWSLSVEEQFYIVWPIFIYLLFKKNWNLLLATILICCASFLINLISGQDHPNLDFYWPITRFWELLSGSILAYFGLHGNYFRQRIQRITKGVLINDISKFLNIFQFRQPHTLISITGLGILIYGIWHLNSGVTFPGGWALIPVIGTLLLIGSGPKSWVNKYLLSNRLAIWIGLISFPLYLWHWPIIVFTRIYTDGEPSTISLIACISLTILCSVLTFLLVEKPIRFSTSKNVNVAALSMLMLMMSALGYVTYVNNGFESRFKGPIREFQKVPNYIYDSPVESQNCATFTNAKSLTICEEKTKPTIFLLGDSHANSLISGLNFLQQRYIFGLDTATGCGNAPYIVSGSYRQYKDDFFCDSSKVRQKFNLYALSKIAEIKPEIVILHARWGYDTYGANKTEAVQLLRETILQINRASLKTKVVVIGPVPNWKTTPLRAIYTAWRTQLDKNNVPAKIKTGPIYESKYEVPLWDDYMQKEIPPLGATYISAYKVFCDEEGCLARVGNSASDVTAIDYGHLSPAGSKYLAENMEKELFSLLPSTPRIRK